MSQHGQLVNCDEALRYIERIPNPITRSLVNMAFVSVVRRVSLEKRDAPCGDFDMLFFVTALNDSLSEHDVIARTLEGEKVGAWFDEES
jgi:hypothetical protein